MSKLNRRTVLRGMLQGTAVTVALPLLNCFLNDNGTALASGAPQAARVMAWRVMRPASINHAANARTAP